MVVKGNGETRPYPIPTAPHGTVNSPGGHTSAASAAAFGRLRAARPAASPAFLAVRPAARTAVRPAARTAVRPAARPVRPAVRPATRPAAGPVRLAVRSAIRPAVRPGIWPAVRPAVRPATAVRRPGPVRLPPAADGLVCRTPHQRAGHRLARRVAGRLVPTGRPDPRHLLPAADQAAR